MSKIEFSEMENDSFYAAPPKYRHTNQFLKHIFRFFSCINVQQNLFVQGPAARSQAVNSQFYLLTRTCRDLKQIAVLGGQMFPGKTADFVKVYRDAVDNSMSSNYPAHLLISCHPMTTRRECQLMSNIFPPNGDRVLYRLT